MREEGNEEERGSAGGKKRERKTEIKRIRQRETNGDGERRWNRIYMYNDKHLHLLYPKTPFTVYTNHTRLRSHKRRVLEGSPKQENAQPSIPKPFKLLTT